MIVCTVYVTLKILIKQHQVLFATISNEVMETVEVEPVGKIVLTNNDTFEKSEKALINEQEELIQLFAEENKQKDEIIQQVFLNLIDIKGMMDNKAYTIHERNEMAIKSVGKILDETDDCIEKNRKIE